jgi:UDP-N-acetyl-D-mannosaminuronic acid transferase (WecB/TagA/CpsF family)
MPSPESAARCVAWLAKKNIQAHPADVYVAPLYGAEMADETLLEKLRIRRPDHVVIALGGGTQERLGLYIKRSLDYRPAIHCIGAAIAFLTGDQVYIPVWSDRLYLGWLFRCLSEPRRYVTRYWRARKLVSLLIRYRNTLPAEKPA